MIDHYQNYLNETEQQNLLEDIRFVLRRAPWFRPAMPRSGQPFRYRMTNCGRLGWVADKDGYRYTELQVNRAPWPAMPQSIWRLACDFGGPDFEPQTCLINYYRHGESLGWHQDKSEKRFDRPVISVSLGSAGEFLVAGNTRPRTPRAGKSFILRSGDVLVMGGDHRLAFHQFTGIVETTPFLKSGGRLSLTIRQVE